MTVREDGPTVDLLLDGRRSTGVLLQKRVELRWVARLQQSDHLWIWSICALSQIEHHDVELRAEGRLDVLLEVDVVLLELGEGHPKKAIAPGKLVEQRPERRDLVALEVGVDGDEDRRRGRRYFRTGRARRATATAGRDDGKAGDEHD